MKKFSIITDKRVSSPYQVRSKSPQFYNIFQNKFFTLLPGLLSDIRIFTRTGLQCNVLMLLQAIYGFRISELLSLRRSDVKSNGFIRVPGTKASNSRIIYFPDILDMQFFKDLGPTEKIFNITYRQYYLILKRNGVEKKIHQYSKKMAVTHMFRHFRLVENELLAPGEIAVQKNFSGHKTDRGINFYRNNKGLLQQINEASTNNP